MNQPHISVVIPTCHRNDMLAKCLSCLAPGSQMLPSGKYEVIVTDDGSKSTAEQMVREQYPWAHWVEGPKQGPAANRNNGSKYAKGEWLVFTDDDCLPEPNWLAAFAHSLTADIWIYEGKTITDSINKGLFFSAPVNETGGFLWSCNLMISKKAFLSLKGFDAEMPFAHLEDVDFRTRIIKNDYISLFVQQAVVLHPQRPVSPILRQVLDHESAFYMSAKHNLPINLFGLTIKSYVLAQMRIALRKSRNPIEAIKFLGTRSLLEGILLIFLTRRWKRKYNMGGK